MGSELVKILVTGATGFIGTHLLSALMSKGGDSVVATSRGRFRVQSSQVEWVEADLASAGWTERLPNESFDIVIHLAQSIHYRLFPEMSRDIFQLNVMATVELAEWATRHQVKRFLFASTGNVYGSENRAFRETDSCHPQSMYGASKLSAEILLKPFSDVMEVLVLRLFGVYGPGQKDSMLPKIIDRFLQGHEITLAGNVGVQFNPVYVQDCVSVLLQMMEKPLLNPYEILNVAGNEIVNLRQVVSMLEQLFPKKADTRGTEDLPVYLVGATKQLHENYGFAQQFGFSEGLKEMFVSFDPMTSE